jgi:hypothetical protein
VEPSYRWVCTYCDASGPAGSSEMARLNVEVHVSMFHSPAREPESEPGGGHGGQDPGPEPHQSRTT